MNELDNVSHMLDGVDSSQWDRLVAARRRKWDSEMKVREGVEGGYMYNTVG